MHACAGVYIVGQFGYAEVIWCLKKNVVILLCRWCLRLSIDFVHGLSCRSILQALVVVASQQLVQMVTVFFSGYMGVDLVLGLIVIGMLGSFSVFV